MQFGLILMLAFLGLEKHAFCKYITEDEFQLSEYFSKPHPLFVGNQQDNRVLGITNEPEVEMHCLEMIKYNGYPAEEHNVTTEDGYIISMYRIPYGKSGPGNKRRQPVLLQHGIFLSSITWVFNTPSKSLGYILADAGYDVWLTNVRGSIYGRNHLYLNTTDKKFWEFSFTEHGLYDMPAMFDYVLLETGFSQVNYIGFSMGTTLAFIMFSQKPEYQAKVRSLMLMAPAISAEHMRHPVVMLMKPFAYDYQAVCNMFGSYDIGSVTPLNDYLATMGTAFCHSPIKGLCNWFPVLVGGFDTEQFNGTRFPVYQAELPAGTSVQCFLHYIQLVDPGFRAYDYGWAKNEEKYGQHSPPAFNIDNINVPIALFWGPGDMWADPIDVANLAPKVPNLVLKYMVPWDKFSHDDFVWAQDAKSLVYDKVIETMQKLWPLD